MTVHNSFLRIVKIVEARHGICPNPTTGQQERYDLSSHICCGGKVFPLEENTRFICCGSNVYNPGDEVCCGGEVRPKSSRLQCCQFREWYNPVTDMCCGDAVLSREGGLMKCCGSTAYNTREETCCPVASDLPGYQWGQMAPLRGLGQCCAGQVIDSDRDICCSGVVNLKSTRYTQCCGNTTFDIRTQACCENTSPFDPRSQMCCKGNVHDSGHGASCCGQNSYLPSEASCCHDNIFEGVPEVPNVQSCCGGVSYFKTNQVCCQDTLHKIDDHMKCCGAGIYNTSSQLCCSFGDETVIHTKSSPSEECCGTSTYQPAIQTCCEHVSRSFDVQGGECCGNGLNDEVQAYRPDQDTCCTGMLGDVLYRGIPSNQSQCCGSLLLSDEELCNDIDETAVGKTSPDDDTICRVPNDPFNSITFNSATEVCLDDGSVEVLSANLDVCGPYLYDPTAELCCEGFIRGRFDQSGNERVCCQGSLTTFAPSQQTCCVGNIHDIPTNSSRCCQTKAYDPNTHMCHETGLVRSLEEVAVYPELCGLTPYDPSEDSCCGGILTDFGQPCCMGYPAHLPEGVEFGECCGFYAYDPHTQICCNGEVHVREGEDMTCCGTNIMRERDREICCDGTLHSQQGGRDACSGHTAFNPLNETVCQGLVFPFPNADCCEARAYNVDSQICCNGFLHARTSDTLTCCGTNVYEPGDATKYCCNGHVSYGDAALECCGDVTINPQSQSCCQTDDAAFIFSVEPASSPAALSLSCCDVETYHSSQHLCCGGVVHMFASGGECCGLDVIRHPGEEICCDGKVVPRIYGDHTECCSGRLIDNRQMTCCNDQILFPDSHTECCGNTVINVFFQGCCGGVSYDIYSESVACCQGELYSMASQTCDEDTGTVLAVSYETIDSGSVAPLQDSADATEESELSICGDQFYDSNIQMCCGNFVVGLMENVICCNGRAAQASSGKTECCADVAYNPRNSDCCQGVLHDKVDGAECCGRSYYQPVKEHCCEQDLIVSRLTGQTCPGTSSEMSDNALQCQCASRSRDRTFSRSCIDGLLAKSRIFVGTIANAEVSTASYQVNLTNALKGNLPAKPGNAREEVRSVLVTAPANSRCFERRLRRGQEVVIFLENATSRLDGSVLRLMRNDVILPLRRRLQRQLGEHL
ncbi:uncharacterized protein [Diadema antillarum]|uniref:uncharacterized protein n=1 Tax=Diadema antillarum TaxID=105358 RepID=UPI003A878964